MICKDPLYNIFRERSVALFVYIGRKELHDNDEKDFTIIFSLNPTPIRVLQVNHLSSTQLMYKMTGQFETSGEVVLIRARDVNLIKLSHKLALNGEDYYGYQDAVGSNLQLRRIDSNYYQMYIVRRDD